MRHWFAGLALALVAPLASAQGLLTEKKFFTLPSYTTQHGKTIKHVRVGYESYGKLKRRRQRDLHRALLLRHLARGRAVQGGRKDRGLLGRDHWSRQGDRHRPIFRGERGHARQSQR